MLTLSRLETTPDLVDQVYQRLLAAISDGSMAPGTRLTQEDVAERLAVSRQPVLQALRLLKADGLVLEATGSQGQKGRGLVVAPIDVQAVIHIYEVRSTLDALAARLAARQRAPLDPLLLVRGRQAAAGQVVKDMVDADLAFHRAIYQASGNPLIESSAMLHWCHIRRAMGEALQTSPLRATVWDEHEAMCQAIAQGEEEHAARLMLAHGAQASRHLVDSLTRPDGPPPHSVVR
ncbi:MAG: GntR family transcriptional regulator [Polaromonas sp.]|nr:GntR family transcriptional regulator [Polaromonas sp.]